MVMATIIVTNTMNNKMIDIHTHILPGADDGIKLTCQAIILLKRMIEEGIEKVILTPHVLSNAQRMSRIEQLEAFKNFQQVIASNNLDIELILGAEVKYREFIHIDYHDYLIENTNYLLIEFPYHIQTPIDDIIYDLKHQGIKPIVAHVERYSYLSIEDYKSIKSSGGLLQMNASSILGKDRYAKNKKMIKELLRLKLIDFVGSDSHSELKNKPSLKKAYHYLKKTLPQDYLDQIFYLNALSILSK
jgi:protein-tyrosine phosphatase